MRDMIAGWVGKPVSVVIAGASTVVKLDGTMMQVNDAGLLLQLAKGQTYVPVSSLLHISLLGERRERRA